MKINGFIFRPAASLPKRFESQADKNAEIARLENMLDNLKRRRKPDGKNIRLIEQRLRKARGIVAL